LTLRTWIGEGQYYTLNCKALGKTGDWKYLFSKK
jgi:hypothetical protein